MNNKSFLMKKNEDIFILILSLVTFKNLNSASEDLLSPACLFTRSWRLVIPTWEQRQGQGVAGGVIEYKKDSNSTRRGHEVQKGVTKYNKGSWSTRRGHEVQEGIMKYKKGSWSTRRGHEVQEGVMKYKKGS